MTNTFLGASHAHPHPRHARPVRMTDAAKASVWSVEFTPWGAFHSATGAQTLNTRFPGQWFQLESGLHYNWHRHYDPTLGRYTQPDPLGFVDGPSAFAYGRNSPLRYVDKDGRIVIADDLIIAGTVLIIGAAITYCIASDHGSGRSTTDDPPPEQNDDDCKDRMSEYQIEQCKVDPHELKTDILGRRARISLYELCRCKNGEVAVRLKGCTGLTQRTGVMCP